MIKLSYDKRTSGMRVSFVVKDSAMSAPISRQELMERSTSLEDGTRVLGQNEETLLMVGALLQNQLKEERRI